MVFFYKIQFQVLTLSERDTYILKRNLTGMHFKVQKCEESCAKNLYLYPRKKKTQMYEASLNPNLFHF